jgi:serine/threonine-protein kinase
MALAPGTRVGPFEVGAQIGVGGMGEVYRAKDTNLGRDVAIKVLPEEFAHDPERVARFEREAKTLASLNHLNIAIIHGLEKAGGVFALVMELVEGPTLADRIASGAIPIDEAFTIARQICEALEAAHEHGIVHRDLKPANIKLRPDGVIKVLDFGLAKALASESGTASGVLSRSPTITSPIPMTRAGVLLGTAAYMSPEQAKGRSADKRSDMWAFGCVLYEMLTGKRAFEAEDVSETLAAVLRDEPDWTALPQGTPAPIWRLLRHCLAKDPKRRIGDASIARIEVDDVQSEPQVIDRREQAARADRMHVARVVAAAVVTLAVAGAMLWMFKLAGGPSPRLARFPIALPAGQRFSSPGHRPLALSPDGAVIVYTANEQLYVRPIDQLEAVAIRGTAGAGPTAARGAFFSPDGQWVGFWQGGQFKKVPIAGGAPVVVCSAQNPWGASWTTDNTILYGQGAQGIWRVSDDGGTPENVVKVDAGQIASAPQMLPGGRAILFTLFSADRETHQIVVQSLDTGELRVVADAGTDARYVPTGHLVYALAGTLLAVPFDAAALTARGGPVPLVDPVAMSPDRSMAYFAVSDDGVLAYVPSDASGGVEDRTLVWVDRQGRETPIKGMPNRRYTQPRLSPDGTRIALVAQEQNNDDIWIWDLARENLARLTTGRESDQDPLWTPDGKSVIFSSGAAGGLGPRNLFRRTADGTGAVDQLTHDALAVPKALTADGRGLVFIAIREPGGPASGGDRGDVMLLPLAGDRRPLALVETPFSETNAELSPDGRWLAYQSDESGAAEIFVRPFPNVEVSKWLVARGSRPVWAGNSRELFYLSANALMSVLVTTGSTISFGKPVKLFEGPYFFGFAGRAFDTTRDGHRFLMLKANAAAGDPSRAARFVVVLNWFEELKRRVPAK